MRIHTAYPRTVKDARGYVFDILVIRFMCGACGRTVSFLPSFCVPHKRHSSAIIALCLHHVLHLGCSIRSTYALFSGRFVSYRSLLRAWVRQWHQNRAVLIQDGLPRLGVALRRGCVSAAGGSPYVDEQSVQCYRACCEFVFGVQMSSEPEQCAADLFVRVQPALAARFPPLGLFRACLHGHPD